MTSRRLPHDRATPATENRRWETPPPPCIEDDENGDPNALKFDRVLDHTKGADNLRAVAAAVAICATCPDVTLAACLREYREEPGVIAGLTHDERVKPKAPTRHPTCGKPHGHGAHRRVGEAACEDCRVASAGYVAARRAKRAAS